jgi:hypothetical protein
MEDDRSAREGLDLLIDAFIYSSTVNSCPQAARVGNLDVEWPQARPMNCLAVGSS